jgi:endogenous inhibitor of DNA gyrase (YacG/DUF329 family)
MDEITLTKRCAICPEVIVYRGPSLLQNARCYCSKTCAQIDDLLLPGEWIDAAEIAPGGRYYDHPEIWVTDQLPR